MGICPPENVKFPGIFTLKRVLFARKIRLDTHRPLTLSWEWSQDFPSNNKSMTLKKCTLTQTMCACWHMHRYAMHSWLRRTQYGWLSQVLTEVNNHVQSLLLNYHFALLRSGDFTYCKSIIKWGNSSTFATVQYVSYFVSIHSLHNNVDPQIPKSNGNGASANYTYHTGIASERSMWVKSQTWCGTRIFLATINLSA